MRIPSFSILGLCAVVFFSTAFAEVPPQDQYLQLYLILQEGEKLEGEGQKGGAYTRYEETSKRLEALQKTNPEWEPSIVSFRLKYVKEKLGLLAGSKPTDTKPAGDSGTQPSVTTALPSDNDSESTAAFKKRITDLESELKETKSRLAEALADAVQLRTKLDQTEKELATARSGAVDEKMAGILEENKSLKSQLSQAETQLKNMQGSGNPNSVPLVEAQLKKLQDQISLLEQENQSFKQTTTDLRQQLEAAQKQLAAASEQAGTAKSGDQFRKENDVLRGIVNRQLQEQARRDAAKKLAAEELDNLKIKSQVLRQQIDILGSPLVALTEEERGLLRGPGQVNVTDGAPTNSSFAAPLTPENTDPANSDVTPPAGGPAAPNDLRNKARIPEDMRSIAQEASDLFAQKRYEEATASYQKIIDKYPDSLYAWSNLGVVRFQQQKYPEAEVALVQAIKLNPSDAFSHTILGIVYYQTGKFDNAVSTLTTAKALDPNDARTRNYLGIACSQKGWQEAAAQECLKAIEIDPNYADPHFNLAVIYATQKPPAKELARRHYKQALDLGIPKDAQLEKLLIDAK